MIGDIGMLGRDHGQLGGRGENGRFFVYIFRIWGVGNGLVLPQLHVFYICALWRHSMWVLGLSFKGGHW